MTRRFLSSLDHHCAGTAWAAGVALVRFLEWMYRIHKSRPLTKS